MLFNGEEMKQVLSRKELMEYLNISRTHLVRQLKKHNIKPITDTVNLRKKLYLLSEVEEAFGFTIKDDGVTNLEKGEVLPNSERDFVSDVDDILKD